MSSLDEVVEQLRIRKAKQAYSDMVNMAERIQLGIIG